MFIILGLIYIFSIYFITGFGFSYFIFRRTKFENFFYLFAPLTGFCLTTAIVSLFAPTHLHFSNLLFFSLFGGTCCTIFSLHPLWKSKTQVKFFKTKIIQFCLIFLFAVFAASLVILPQILTNQYGYFHYGNDELMYYSGRTFLMLSDNLQNAKTEQFDRFGTLLFASTISYYLHLAPPLIIQLVASVARMIFIFSCFGVCQFLRINIFGKKSLGIFETIALGSVLALSALEYEHYLLDYLAAQVNLGIFLLFILLLIDTSLFHNRKVVIIYSFLLAILTISYPEIAILVIMLLLGSLSIRAFFSFCLSVRLNYKHLKSSFFTDETKQTIKSWILFGISTVLLLTVIGGINALSLYFNYAMNNTANNAVGGSIFGDPKTNFLQFIARILGLQFLNFMPVNTPPSSVLIGFGIIALFFLLFWYKKLVRVSQFAALIIPVCFFYAFMKGMQTNNYYQFSKLFLYFNSFTLILWLSIQYKAKQKIIFSSFLIIFFLFNTFSIYRHTKYYIIQQIPNQFFSYKEIELLKKEIQDKNYKTVIVNSPWYALWEFFYQNQLPISPKIIKEQNFIHTISDVVKLPNDTLVLSFPFWANRFIDTSYADKKLQSIFIIYPKSLQKKAILVTQEKSQNNDIVHNEKAFLLCSDTTPEKSVTLSVENNSGKLLLVTTNVSTQLTNAAIMKLADLTNKDGRETKTIYPKQGFSVDMSLPQKERLRESLKTAQYQQIGLSYRIPEGTKNIRLIYSLSGKEPSCAIFEDTEILIITSL
jgi:hypothetical protein